MLYSSSPAATEPFNRSVMPRQEARLAEHQNCNRPLLDDRPGYNPHHQKKPGWYHRECYPAGYSRRKKSMTSRLPLPTGMPITGSQKSEPSRLMPSKFSVHNGLRRTSHQKDQDTFLIYLFGRGSISPGPLNILIDLIYSILH